MESYNNPLDAIQKDMLQIFTHAVKYLKNENKRNTFIEHITEYLQNIFSTIAEKWKKITELCQVYLGLKKDSLFNFHTTIKRDANLQLICECILERNNNQIFFNNQATNFKSLLIAHQRRHSASMLTENFYRLKKEEVKYSKPGFIHEVCKLANIKLTPPQVPDDLKFKLRANDFLANKMRMDSMEKSATDIIQSMKDCHLIPGEDEIVPNKTIYALLIERRIENRTPKTETMLNIILNGSLGIQPEEIYLQYGLANSDESMLPFLDAKSDSHSSSLKHI